MAYTTMSSVDASPFKIAPFSAIARVFAGFYASVSFASEGNARLKRVAALNAKSDAELAAMGLKRAEIAQKVFGDLYYI